MNKNILMVLLALVAIGAGLAVTGVFSKKANTTTSGLVVAPRVFEGHVIYPLQAVPVRLAVMAGGIVIADSATKDNKYRVELPAEIPSTVAFTLLQNISLLHGEGHLQAKDGVKAAEVKLILYQDLNKNAAFDTGEPQLEGTFFQADANPNLQSFFQHKLILLNGDASLKTSMDSASGAKDYYRYDLDLKAGWVLLESELTGQYVISQTKETKWDVVLPRQNGGDGSPPAFTPN